MESGEDMIVTGNNLGSEHHALILFDLNGSADGTEIAMNVFDFQKAVFPRVANKMRLLNADESWNF